MNVPRFCGLSVGSVITALNLLVSSQQLDEFVSYGLPDYYYNVMSAQDIARHVMSLQGR
jgi:hypothetical protein